MLVLDTNEFIIALTDDSDTPSRLLLRLLIKEFPPTTISIPKTIFNELQRRLHPAVFKEFKKSILPLIRVDEDFFIPYELGEKYAMMRLKPADALIAAYTEWIKADILISENRHFLAHKSGLPFKVTTASQFLKSFP